MKFVTLTPREFDDYTETHYSHFTQTSKNYYDLLEKSGAAHLLGVKDNKGNVVAASLFSEARALKFFKYFYSQRGPVMDYNNIELVEFFFKNLTAYLEKHNCLYVRVDPYIIEHVHTADGDIIQSYDNRILKEKLEKLGYRHQGMTIGFTKISQIPWLSVLNLKDKSEKQLLKEMDYQTRRNIKKTEEMGVKIRTLSSEETPKFYELVQMAEEKHNFSFRDEDYYRRLQKAYEGRILLQLAYINLTDYKTKLETKLQNLETQYQDVQDKLKENANSKKQKTKAQQLDQQINSTKRKINETQAQIESDGEELDLASAVYIYNNHEMYYLSSGSNPAYNPYMGAYALQWEMIKYAKNLGIDRYNFYGVSGDFSENAEDYGVQQFKKGFNAHVENYIGDFIKVIKPAVFRIGKLTGKI
ncbi:aminoacyltransferase [Staphylococcus sp. SQ8-PEA]|uniref:Aminoacyltransferase FemA n=1 Tax=Staphylococcus marylandisciuri TaxID=2981529 RepID=A0ABT2QMT6_9STAP|nr:aminoacyltransferase [Staphylococcus marylandisciuri]MCU5745293.1 aminoacyltransferase [Staphylococcus marylandisciuri]